MSNGDMIRRVDALRLMPADTADQEALRQSIAALPSVTPDPEIERLRAALTAAEGERDKMRVNLEHWRQEVGKLHSRVATLDADGIAARKAAAENYARAEAAEAQLAERDAATDPFDDVSHFDDFAVAKFATHMKAKMALARGKGRCGWNDPTKCDADYLRQLLYEHLEKGDPVDVANFCMMLHFHKAGTARDFGNTLDLLRAQLAERDAAIAAAFEAAAEKCANAFAEHITAEILGEPDNSRGRESAAAMAERLLHEIRTLTPSEALAALERVKAEARGDVAGLVEAGNVMAKALRGDYIVPGSAAKWEAALAAWEGRGNE